MASLKRVFAFSWQFDNKFCHGIRSFVLFEGAAAFNSKGKDHSGELLVRLISDSSATSGDLKKRKAALRLYTSNNKGFCFQFFVRENNQNTFWGFRKCF